MPKAYTRQSWQDPCSVNRTYLTIGQDLFSIQEYVTSQYNASLHSHNDDDDDKKNTRPMKDFFPAATMFYTDIQNLKGMDTPIDYGSGIEYAKGLAEAYPKSGIQIGLWLNGTQGCRDIVNGNLTTNIYHMFHSILQWKVPKVFLRVGYGTLSISSIFVVTSMVYLLLTNNNNHVRNAGGKNLIIHILDIQKIHPYIKMPFEESYWHVKIN